MVTFVIYVITLLAALGINILAYRQTKKTKKVLNKKIEKLKAQVEHLKRVPNYIANTKQTAGILNGKFWWALTNDCGCSIKGGADSTEVDTNNCEDPECGWHAAMKEVPVKVLDYTRGNGNGA